MEQIINKNEELANDIGEKLNSFKNKNSAIVKVIKSYKDETGVPNGIDYVASHPIDGGTYGLGCSGNPSEAIMQFAAVKAFYDRNYDGKVEGRHYVVAFAMNDWINMETIPYIALQVAMFFWSKGFQVFYGIHYNECGFHVHMIVNAYPVFGNKKLPISEEFKIEYKRYLKGLEFYGNKVSFYEVNGFY